MWMRTYTYVRTALAFREATPHDNIKPNEATLLGSPPELRNKIYRLVLVQSDNTSDAEIDSIVLNHSHHSEPKLRQTCRQVRAEATRISLEENGFVIVVQDLMPQMPLRSARHWIWKARLKRYAYHGGPDWANLKEWMRLRFADELSEAWAAKDLALFGVRTWTLSNVTAHACDISRAMQAKGRPWEEIEVVLVAYKMGIEGSHGPKAFWT